MHAYRIFSPDDEPAPIPATVADVIRAYDDAEGPHQSKTSLENRRRDWGLFIEAYGHLPYQQLRKFDVIAFVRSHPTWKSAWTQKRFVATICRPFAWALKLDLIDRNPLAGLSMPKGPRGRPLTDIEYRAVLRATSALFRRVLMFLRFTGCRPGELAALRWDMIDMVRGVAILQQHKTRHRTGKERYIALHAPCVMRLLLWLRRHASSDYVFTNARGGPWSKGTLDQRLNRLRVVIGLDKSAKLYGCRHKFATDLLKRGADLKEVAELLGHEDTRTTEENYVHLHGDVDYLRNAILKGFPDK